MTELNDCISIEVENTSKEVHFSVSTTEQIEAPLNIYVVPLLESVGSKHRDRAWRVCFGTILFLGLFSLFLGYFLYWVAFIVALA